MDPTVFPIAKGSSAPLWFCRVLGLLTLGLGTFLGALSFAGSRFATLEVSDQDVRISGDIYGRSIPRSALDTASARMLDRVAEPGFAPRSRTNGIGLPNYQSGWFRLADGSRALLFVTDWAKAVVLPTTEAYTLLVSPADPRAFLEAVKAPGQAPSSFPLSESASRSGSAATWLLLVLSVVLPLAISGLLFYVASSSRRVTFEVSAAGLRVRGDMFARLIPRSDLLVEEARVTDLRAEPEHRPVLRTCGVGLPGYSSGWFRLKDRSKALLFLTDRTRAVFIPTTRGYALLLSPDDPDGFVAALRT